MSVDMSRAAIRRRLEATRPPSLAPEHRLDHKIDMSRDGVTARLREVDALRRLQPVLAEMGAALRGRAREDSQT